MLIGHLSEDVTLEFPDFKAAMEEQERAFVIQTDASRVGLAGILGQLDGKGKARPIYFVSRVCKEAETRYGITELEALALYFAVKKFAPFIVGIKTIVETDHSALVQMFQNPKECASARINKWAMDIMSRFDLVIHYKPGKSNANVDALSRAPMVINCAVGEAIPQEITSKEYWLKGQLTGEFGEILKYITKRNKPEDLSDFQKILNKLNEFIVQNDLLYFIDPQSQDLRLVVPNEFQQKLFHEKHAGYMGTHQSGRKIYETLKKQFFWTNMRADCKHWGRACHVCACCRVICIFPLL